MSMAPPIILTYPSTTEPLRHADPELVRQRARRREAFRRSVIAAVAVAVAAFLVGAFFLVGQHLLTAWWLERQDGMVLWDIDKTNWRQGGVTSVSFAARNSWIPRLRDGDLNHFRRLHRVVSLNLAENDRITNKGLSGLRGLDFLAELNLERLERYRQVHFGSIFIPFTDACLVHLQALPRLENLTLAGNLITDQGMSQIAQMSSLKVLDLSATEVTDSALVHIEGMRNLERVDLGATRVTDEGLAQLRLARPDLTIELDVDPAVEQAVKATRGLDR
jgi:Leucine rich repeat/Leucine Rich repeat